MQLVAVARGSGIWLPKTRELIACVLSHPAGGHLLQQPQEMTILGEL